MESAAKVVEERIGSLLVRSATRAGEDASYRDPALAARVEITRDEGSAPRGNFRAPLGASLGLLLTAALAAFLRVHSWPAVGVAATALSALAWLWFSGPRRTVERARVWVADGELHATGAEGPARFRADDVEGFGIGEEKPLSTLFARVSGQGRVLLLDGLTREEAEAAASRLTDALERAAA